PPQLQPHQHQNPMCARFEAIQEGLGQSRKRKAE
ncbi:hypothetical protein Pmani_032040, partial [Petrolisthes manimaculis]